MPHPPIIINSAAINIEELSLTKVSGTEEREDLAPHIKGTSNVFLPIRFLVTLLGFQADWSITGESIVFTRGKTQVIFKNQSNMALVDGMEIEMKGTFALHYNAMEIPLSALPITLGFTIHLGPEGGMQITDQVTLPVYTGFLSRRPVSSINRIFVEDMNGDGKCEFLTVFESHEGSLAFEVLSSKGELLLERLLTGLNADELKPMELEKDRLYVLNCSDGGHVASAYVLRMVEDRTELVGEFISTGFISMTGAEIYVSERRYDTAQHLVKNTYIWNGEGMFFEHTGTETGYWFGESMVDRSSCESVAQAFYEALVLGAREEASSYCSGEISSGYIDTLCDYHLYHYRVEQQETVKLNVVSNGEKAEIYVYYADFNITKYRKPNRIHRLVLELSNDQWSITFVNNLENAFPPEILLTGDVEYILEEETLYTDRPCYEIELGTVVNLTVYTSYGEEYISSLRIRCSKIQFVYLLPGMMIKLYDYEHPDKEPVHFEAMRARWVYVTRLQEDYCEINIKASAGLLDW